MTRSVTAAAWKVATEPATVLGRSTSVPRIAGPPLVSAQNENAVVLILTSHQETRISRWSVLLGRDPEPPVRHWDLWAFDGHAWSLLGNPQGTEDRCNQIHALEVYRGQLHATTWPEGHVVRLEANGGWTDVGRLGDALEINALSVYNGQLYGGTIPRAEVFRFDPTIEPGTAIQIPPPQRKPQRRARPVTVPRSCPTVDRWWPTLPSASIGSSVGNGPEPTRVV